MAKWPKKIKFRNRVLAKIYPPSKGRKSYRATWYAAGKRQMKSFSTFAGTDGAKAFADALVKELASNAQSSILTAAQASDALAAIECLNTFQVATGRQVSLLASVSEFCAAKTKLGDRTLTEAVDGFLQTAVTVKRQELGNAVEEFITGEQPRTVSKDGNRPELSPKYHANRAASLRRFSKTFNAYGILDLGKHDLDNFFKSKWLSEMSPKSRNHHRAFIAQFTSWCVRKDYLSAQHRLGEADAMRQERSNLAEVEFYSPEELASLIESADGPMKAMVAIGGLAGLRTKELLRLDWSNVWRTAGHIEVTSSKSKTRQRRLVKMCASLEKMLAPFKNLKSGKAWAGSESAFNIASLAVWQKAGVNRKRNGLRHSFCTYHLALHANELLTAKEAGNSPAMIYAHYNGLATDEQANNWFNLKCI